METKRRTKAIKGVKRKIQDLVCFMQEEGGYDHARHRSKNTGIMDATSQSRLSSVRGKI